MSHQTLKQRWATRRWYDLALAALGFGLLCTGGSFFTLVAWVGAPVMPYTGLAVAILGLWLGFIRPFRRSPTPEFVRELNHDK